LHKTVTAHPLGGCPIGDDPASSVSDSSGEVWGHQGLFVVDGSMVPTGLGVNPSLTIAALAERASAAVVERAGRPSSTRVPQRLARTADERDPR
jgi:choline dehydrogenase-like flavoprotein